MKRYDVHIERVVLGTGVSYAKTVAHENPNGDYAMYDEANARIAELTAEVDRLEDELRNEQHALRLADRAGLDLAEKCSSYEVALEKISRMAPETIPDPTPEQLERNFVYIARNALKEGV